MTRRARRTGGGKRVDDTLCASNHGDATLLTTSNPERVTCKRCLKLMEPKDHLKEMFEEQSKEFNRISEQLDQARCRIDTLESALRYAIDSLGFEAHVVAHVPTGISIGQLLTLILNSKVEFNGEDTEKLR